MACKLLFFTVLLGFFLTLPTAPATVAVLFVCREWTRGACLAPHLLLVRRHQAALALDIMMSLPRFALQDSSWGRPFLRSCGVLRLLLSPTGSATFYLKLLTAVSFTCRA